MHPLVIKFLKSRDLLYRNEARVRGNIKKCIKVLETGGTRVLSCGI